MWSVIIVHNRTIPFFGLDEIKLIKIAQANPDDQ